MVIEFNDSVVVEVEDTQARVQPVRVGRCVVETKPEEAKVYQVNAAIDVEVALRLKQVAVEDCHPSLWVAARVNAVTNNDPPVIGNVVGLDNEWSIG